jgi:hypothetical protein
LLSLKGWTTARIAARSFRRGAERIFAASAISVRSLATATRKHTLHQLCGPFNAWHWLEEPTWPTPFPNVEPMSQDSLARRRSGPWTVRPLASVTKARVLSAAQFIAQSLQGT